MVLDAKAMTWAARNGIDTAKLKAAKVPIFGKWYFPEIPRGVSLVNLETGEVDLFRIPMLAGEVLWVRSADLRRLGLGGDLPELHEDYGAAGSGDQTSIPPPLADEVEPMITLARVPAGFPHAEEVPLPPAVVRQLDVSLPLPEPAQLGEVHLSNPSVAPLVLGIGACLILAGIVASWVFALVGVIWVVAGAVAWIRVGRIEAGTTSGRSAAIEQG